MGPDQTDEELLRAFVAGNRRALAELARRYERSLLGFSNGLLGGRNDLACDVVQETWVRVIRFAGSFDGRARFKTWLYRITMNACRNLLAAQPAATPLESVEAQSPTDADPAQTVQSNDVQQRIRGAVEQLPPEKREVVLLCYHGGMTHEQAAEILKTPLGTLKSRLHAALQELREQLSPEMKS